MLWVHSSVKILLQNFIVPSLWSFVVDIDKALDTETMIQELDGTGRGFHNM